MNNEPTINRLFLTNNYSIVSKYSAVKLGYFDDKILEEFIENYFAGKSWRRTPLVNRGYGARLLAIDSIVNHFISTKSVDCFIVLGAGYDTLPFRATNANCCFIELDLPQVVDVKSKFIRDKKVLKDEDLNQIGNRFSSSGLTYHLVACDLRDTSGLFDILRSTISSMAESHICPKNFAIINEVCLCYLKTSDVSGILKTVIESVTNSAHKVHYIGYEQVNPDKDSQFNSVMLDHFRSIGHPIKHYPNSREVHRLTDDLGFSQVKIESMHKVFHTDMLFPRSHHRGYVEEPFDEYEEMDLYLSHYALVKGTLHVGANSDSQSSGQCIDSAPHVDVASDHQGNQLDANNLNVCERQVSLIRSEIQRFGHSSCLMNVDDSGVRSVLSSGGFGKSQASASSRNINHQHKRLSDSFVLSIDSDKPCNVKSVDISDVVSKFICMDRMHGQCCEISDNLLFFNGGRQGPAKFNSCNVPFLASLVDGTQLIVEHQFKFEESTLKWRHKVTNLDDIELLQVGGKGIPNGCSGVGHNSVVIWNMSSDKLGSHCKTSSYDDTMFFRHSFGLDKRDSKTILLFGGLSPSNLPHNDVPIDKSQAALLWDLRVREPARLAIESAQCYGANVHFISDNQFVKMGGISTRDGLSNGIELFDLRQTGQFSVENVPLPVDVDGKSIILINATTCHLKNERKIITLGGGGNYFTFGTHFNDYNLVYQY